MRSRPHPFRADGIYGEASPRIDRRTGFIGSADVVIAGDIAGDAVQQHIVVYLTALHELGHALGPFAMMNCS